MFDSSPKKVFRSGATVARYNFETDDVVVANAKKALVIRFKLASKGGGVTDVKLEITGEAFDEVCSAMRRADPAAAVSAMASEINAHHNPRKR